MTDGGTRARTGARAAARLVEVRVPGDKSITHRALILSSLATGRSRLSGLLDAADTRATAAALRALGVRGIPDGPLSHAEVEGRGPEGWVAPSGALDCANSGTTARLLLGALAGCPFDAVLTGDPSLRARPMRRVTEPLAVSGARFDELDAADRLPIRVTGGRPLAPLDHDGPRASAQVKSALLLAGVTGGGPVRVSEPMLSRDHTERMLRAMGATVETATVGGATVGGAMVGGRVVGGRVVGGAAPGTPSGRRHEIRLSAGTRLEPADIPVPGDLSAAAFFLALGAVAGGIAVRGVGLNPGRAGVLDVLRRMGARVEVTPLEDRAGEPVGDVVVRPEGLRGVLVAAREVPSLIDEVPVLAALAAVAEGESRFEGLDELRVKETDRVAALGANLRAIGVEVEEGRDRLIVVGRGGPEGLRGRVASFGDHRIAMAFGVLGALPGTDIDIEGRGAVEISYPGFWSELERVKRELE